MFRLLPSSRGDSVCLGRIGPLWLKQYQIPVSARHTHLYCIGTTGSGKSKFLESLLVSDIRAGRGCGLVDPHTDLARDTLTHLASVGFFNDPQAYERVIYFDPTRTDYVIPFNILKSPFDPYAIAQQVIEAFRRTWPQTLEEAPRFTNIALNALLVLIETGQTLIEMPRLLSNKPYREQLLDGVSNSDVIEFFHNSFDKWGKEAPLFIESVMNKVGAFVLNPHLKHILGASQNRLDFRKLMDNGQVLIVDLGRCDGETQRLIGSLITTGIEAAALSRTDEQSRRHPFYFFIDEFQDFSGNAGAAKTLARILSECRKFGLYLHLAHQTLGQIQERIASALGNVGIKIVFGVDREDAEVMAKKLFLIDTGEVKHEAGTDTQHPLYAPLPEQWERYIAGVCELPPRIAWVKRRGENVIRMKTETIKPYRVTPSAVEELTGELVRTHGVALSELEKPPLLVHRPAQPVRIVNWEPALSVTRAQNL